MRRVQFQWFVFLVRLSVLDFFLTIDAGPKTPTLSEVTAWITKARCEVLVSVEADDVGTGCTFQARCSYAGFAPYNEIVSGSMFTPCVGRSAGDGHCVIDLSQFHKLVPAGLGDDGAGDFVQSVV